MSFVPHYDLELQPGMITDFTIGKVPGWNESISNKSGSAIEYDDFIIEWCISNLHYPFVVLGRNTGDWAFHLQISNRDDEDILRKYCEVEEIKESWT